MIDSCYIDLVEIETLEDKIYWCFSCRFGARCKFIHDTAQQPHQHDNVSTHRIEFPSKNMWP